MINAETMRTRTFQAIQPEIDKNMALIGRAADLGALFTQVGNMTYACEEYFRSKGFKVVRNTNSITCTIYWKNNTSS